VNAEDEITELKKELQRLHEEVADLRNKGIRGSKTEALMALQYDSLPDWYKMPKAVALQKKIQTVIPFILVLGFLVAVFIFYPLIWGDDHSQMLWQNNSKFFSDKP
jgi:hypothetical protein